ncbi:MAG: FecR domain-containing protein [Deltaproteobacteria bacterium]|nr:FecR domain-containing protein [Deltaproteobacteria bacterium]MBW2035279.1 FecR domain-containing protein [Deltaproteobacteria bacterium]MBW2115638.1 FecR domain-containing protein [Deltaproteobacteria bacterium]
MKTGRKKTLVLVVALMVGLFLTFNISVSESDNLMDRLLGNFKKEHKPVKPLLPPGVVVKPGFEVGKGVPVGKAQMVQGEALVVHKGESVAYYLKKDLPLFTGDMLVTKEKSRVSVILNDQSVFALAPVSKLVIDKSIYDPEKKKRTSRMSLWFGRARFMVAKITGKSSYKVRTPTAVCGVRGSDFALAVTPGVVKTSSLPTFLSSLNPVKDAHAATGSMHTTVLTGPETSADFAGDKGPPRKMGPNSLSDAEGGKEAIPILLVPAKIVAGIFAVVGPGLAAISMPPGID